MKKIVALFALFAILLCTIAFAQTDPSVPPAGFEFLTPVISFLLTLPKIGPVLGIVFQVIALVASVMTILSTAVYAILKLPELGARVVGASAFADKIKAFADKVLPWLQYLSIFNVQKPTLPPV